jgi:hypothetical protein
VCRFQIDVAQPVANDRQIHSRLQQAHGGRMAECMWGNRASGQGWTVCARLVYDTPDEMPDAMPCERTSGVAHEQRRGRGDRKASFLTQMLEHRHHLTPD